MEDEPLFQIENEFDLKTENRLQDFYVAIIQKPNMIVLFIFYILSIVAFIYGLIFLNEDIISYLIIEGIFTAVILVIFIYPRLQKALHKKNINSKSNRNIRKQNFLFFGDYLLAKEGKIQGKYKYLKIFRVYSTNKDFFFRINKNIIFILPKDRIKEIDKFEEFLKRKFQQRYIAKEI